MLFRLMVVGMIFMNAVYANFYENHAEGWFWYHDPVLEEDEMDKKAKKEKPGDPQKEKPKTALDHLAEYKQHLELKKAEALMNPSYANVQNYMVAQKNMSDKADHFSKVWQKVVLTTPELNPEIKNPTSQFVRQVKNDQEVKRKREVLSTLSKSYGLFLFVSENCPYCKAFAPVVKEFAKRYGFSVMVVYTGRQVDPEIGDMFEDVQANNGMAQAFGVDQAPALMAFDASAQDLIPVSYGATSLDTLETNLMTLSEKKYSGDHK